MTYDRIEPIMTMKEKIIIYFITLAAFVGFLEFIVPPSAPPVLYGLKDSDFYPCAKYYDCTETKVIHNQKVIIYKDNPHKAFGTLQKVIAEYPNTEIVSYQSGYFLAKMKTRFINYYIEGRINTGEQRIFLKCTSTRKAPFITISENTITNLRNNYQKKLVSRLKTAKDNTKVTY